MTPPGPSPGAEAAAWVEVRVDVPLGWGELVADVLTRHGCGAVLQEGAPGEEPRSPVERLRASLPAGRDGPPIRAALREGLAELARRAGAAELAGLEVSFRALAPEEAAAAWRESWRPFRVGRLCVVPPWDGRTLRAGDLRIVLEPGGVFGTGRHSSTRACMRLLQGRLRAGDRVLDAGTGTGILAVSSALLGASRAFGFDVDPSSAPAARELAERSGVGEACRFATGGFELLEGEDAAFDGLLANLYADVLRAEAGRLARALRPGGWFVLGGIARERLDELRRSLAEGPLGVEAVLGGRWSALAGRRRG